MRVRRAGCALLVVVFASTLLGPAVRTQEVPSVAEVPEAITDLLGDYTRAYREHDEDLIRATVGRALLDRERQSLANASEVPFSSFEIVPVTQFSGDLASKRIKDNYGGEQVATYHVTERTQIGNETDVYEEDGAYTFLREEGRDGYDGWRLVSKSDLDILGFFSPYHLWDEDDVRVVTSERFILLTHPDAAESMRPVLEIAERAYDRVDAFWPGQQRERYVVIVPTTTEELGRIMHETVDLAKFVAFVAAGADLSRGYEPTGPRMFIHLSHLRNYGAPAQTEILAHELVHAVTRPMSGPQIPTWVEEGLANFAGGEGGRPSRAGLGPRPDTFPSNDRFVTGPVQQIQAVYDQSQVAIEVLDSQRGRAEVAEFYTELGSRRVVVGTDEYHVRNAIEESAGWSYDEWVNAWRGRLG